MDYHLATVADVARELTTAPTGLDAATAGQRLAEHGPNKLAETPTKTVWQLMLASVAFATGFAGYLAVARMHTPAAPDTTWQATISARTAPDGWNVGQAV